MSKTWDGDLPLQQRDDSGPVYLKPNFVLKLKENLPTRPSIFKAPVDTPPAGSYGERMENFWWNHKNAYKWVEMCVVAHTWKFV